MDKTTISEILWCSLMSAIKQTLLKSQMGIQLPPGAHVHMPELVSAYLCE